jgi:CheY-like chemotaxis protein
MERKTQILIVEDELIVAENLRLALAGMGYEVPEPAGDSSTAIERAASLCPDLILMDIVLEGSGLDGIETAERIAKIMDVPVIFVTAHSDKKTLSRVKATGPYAYILKPFNERELAFAIELALERYGLDCEIKKRDSLLLATSFAIEWFLRRQPPVAQTDPAYEKNLSAGIMDILEHIGFAVHAASVCIFRLNPGNGGRDGAAVQYLWVDPGVTASGKVSFSRSDNLTFTTLLWRSLLGSGNAIACDVESLPGHERQFFADRGIASVAVLPLFRNDSLWGFVGFSDITSREWSDSEMEALQIAGNLIGAVLG